MRIHACMCHVVRAYVHINFFCALSHFQILVGCNEEGIREMTRETIPYFVLTAGIAFLANLIQVYNKDSYGSLLC